MINIILSILIMATLVVHCYLAIRDHYPILLMAIYSACTGAHYYWMCRMISEYLFNTI